MSLDIGLRMNLDTGGKEPYEVRLYSSNYTGNVWPMWEMSGCGDALYESDGKLASEIIPDLEHALPHMKANPDDYRALNPSNGWGNYEGAMDFVAQLLTACKEHPKASVWVWV